MGSSNLGSSIVSKSTPSMIAPNVPVSLRISMTCTLLRQQIICQSGNCSLAAYAFFPGSTAWRWRRTPLNPAARCPSRPCSAPSCSEDPFSTPPI